jgi:hypothetical protein
MVKERCWRCNKLRNDVELRANDDRMCEPCSLKNDEELAVVRRDNKRKNGVATPKLSSASTAHTAAPASVNSPVPRGDDLTGVTAAKRSRQATGSSSSSCAVLHAQSVPDGNDNPKAAVLRYECGEVTQLTHRVDQLASIVQQQKDVINMLTSQLNFVLSFLDIQQSVFNEPLTSTGTSMPGMDDAVAAATAACNDGLKPGLMQQGGSCRA